MSPANDASERGATSAEIHARYGTGPRTLSKYADLGLIARPKLRGRHTTYPPEQVTRIAAIQVLKAQGYLLSEMRHALSKLSAAELRALAYPAAPAAPPAPPAQPTMQAAAATTTMEIAGHVWRRVTLLPGLELSVAADATAFVLRIAGEIATRYATREPGA